ncbi:hypothetical protein FD755_006472 [Muntiacus reevesi]|uniref:U4/U6.U5 small nuclear ribonucleoprotein 27kDa protein domain-containing protein n=1 Tax=Muntiacus reevesi TaxID=9886 RepID=A0A5J5MX07_MUNRE|nr:hypothetical protein FD755_006472 [Muntiacus reevesi]
MGRNHSRAPRSERRRSWFTSLERESRRTGRSGSRESPRRHRSTSPSPSRLKETRDEEKKETKETNRQNRGRNRNDKLMGFASFDSTKGKKVNESIGSNESKRWIQQTFGFHCMSSSVEE